MSPRLRAAAVAYREACAAQRAAVDEAERAIPPDHDGSRDPVLAWREREVWAQASRRAEQARRAALAALDALGAAALEEET